MSQCKGFCPYMWFLWVSYAQEKVPTAYAGTITFVKIDLHIHRQQEEVFDVFFHQGAARLDCSTKEDELGWRWQQGSALITQGCSHTGPRQEEQRTSSSRDQTQRAALIPPKPTVIREKAESVKQGSDQQRQGNLFILCAFVSGLQCHTWIYCITCVSHRSDNHCHC